MESETISIISGIAYALGVFIYPYLVPGTMFFRVIYIIMIFAPLIIIPLLIIYPQLLKRGNDIKTFLMFYSLISVASSGYPIIQIYLTGITDLSYVNGTIRGVFIAGIFTAIERLVNYLQNKSKPH